MRNKHFHIHRNAGIRIVFVVVVVLLLLFLLFLHFLLILFTRVLIFYYNRFGTVLACLLARLLLMNVDFMTCIVLESVVRWFVFIDVDVTEEYEIAYIESVYS